MTTAGSSSALAVLAYRFRRSSLRAVLPLVAVCAVLAGCASATGVTSADQQGTLTVSARATGGRLAWARAHKRALTEANEYCERRGMQTSFATERTQGFQAFEQQTSVVRFECNPKL
ncbi:Lipoprotein [Paraburkholderia sacchari]|uniref:hypothetical protein n=1 Tax=Paraburkholderia sacchari TaxID=159450 RepID=UPI0039A4304D